MPRLDPSYRLALGIPRNKTGQTCRTLSNNATSQHVRVIGFVCGGCRTGIQSLLPKLLVSLQHHTIGKEIETVHLACFALLRKLRPKQVEDSGSVDGPINHKSFLACEECLMKAPGHVSQLT